jgi:DHA2 family lincomycin resistance protein-like MFS transporter
MATLQQVAGAAGTALFVTVMAVASTGSTAGADVEGARAAFMAAAIIATVALPLTFLVGAGASNAPAVQPDGAVGKGGRPDV